MSKLNLFIRQSYTEAGDKERNMIQSVINLIKSKNYKPYEINLMTGAKAYNQNNFKTAYEEETGLEFTPTNFRKTRFKLLQECDAMVIIRTGMSESTSFEICYNIFSGHKAPILFLIYRNNPIKTTLLRDLDELVDTTYVTFECVDELNHPIEKFFSQLMANKNISGIE